MPVSHPTRRRGLAYYRMSDDDQTDSIPQQKLWAARTSARESIDLAAEFEDGGISGSKTDQRPGLMAALRAAEDAAERGRPFDVLLVWDLNRLSRADSFRTGGIMARLMDAGVSVVLTNAEGTVDLADETQRVMFNLKQDFGRNAYVRSLSADVLRGMDKAAREGRFMTKPPIGYVAGEDGRLKPEGGRGEAAVRRLFRDCLAGMTLSELTRRLNDEGPPPARGSLWSRTAVRAILRNRTYVGAVVWNVSHLGTHHRVGKAGVRKDTGSAARESRRRRKNMKGLAREANAPEDVVVVENAHPAIISPEEFAEVGRLLASRRGRQAGRGSTGELWVLSGLLHCQCGRVMHGVRHSRKKNGHAYLYRHYRCSAKNYQGAAGCPDSGRAQHDWAVREAARLLKEKLGGPDAAAEIRDRMRLAASRHAVADRETADACRARSGELAGWIAQGNRNLALLPADRIPGVVEQLRAWEAEREAVSARLAALDAGPPADESLDSIEKALALIGRLEEVVGLGDPLAVRNALAPLVRKLTLTFRPATPEDRRGGVNGNLQFVPERMRLELHPHLLNLFATAIPTEQVELTVEGPVVWP